MTTTTRTRQQARARLARLLLVHRKLSSTAARALLVDHEPMTGPTLARQAHQHMAVMAMIDAARAELETHAGA